MVPRLLNYLLVPFYTILVFNKSEYGQITELYAYVAILLVLLTYGMETSFFRYANKDGNANKVYNTALTSILTTAIVFLALVFVFLSDISSAIRYSGHNEYILMIAIIVVIDAFTALPFAWLRFKDNAKRFSIIRIISVSINISFNLLFLVVLPKWFPEQTASFSYFDQNGIIPGSGYKRGTARVNIDHTVSDRFTFGTNIYMTSDKRDRRSGWGNGCDSR